VRNDLPSFAHVILLPGWYENNWYEAYVEGEGVNCTKEQMKIAAEGHLTTEAIMWNQDNRKTFSGMVRLSSANPNPPFHFPCSVLPPPTLLISSFSSDT